MRVVLLSAVWIPLGCSGSDNGTLGDGSGIDAGAVLDAPGDGDAAVVPPPLIWTAVNANIVEGDIVSIWGTSAADVYVGTDMKSVYLVTNGASTWTGLSAQIVGGGWGAGPQSVYAVGASAWLTPSGSPAAGLFHYAGDRAWTSVAAGKLYSVWGSAPDDVYAGGDPGVIHSVDGVSFASESSAGGGILSVWGSGPTDVFAGASSATGTILHSAGDGSWQPVYTEAGCDTWAGWSSGPGDAYAIMVPGGTANPPAHLVHSMAQGWVRESVSPTPTTLVAVWGSGAGDVYAGGWHLDSAGKAGDLFHSTGNGQWTPVPLPGTPYDVRCVWGTSATDVYVGIYDAQDGPVILHGQP